MCFLNISGEKMSDFIPYTTIDDSNGHIYKHTEEYGVGTIHNNNVLNLAASAIGRINGSVMRRMVCSIRC